MPNSISPSQISANATIFVQGIVEFSHITKHRAGAELVKENQRRQRMGLVPIEKPYVDITLKNPVVIPKVPGQLTIEDQYIQNRFYNKTDGTGLRYNMISKSPYLPHVAVRDQNNPNIVTQVNPKGELANDLNVTLVLRTYQAGSYANKGVSLDAVIVNEPVRYYIGAGMSTRLQERGITYNQLPDGEFKNTDLDDQAMQQQNEAVAPPTGNAYSGALQNAQQVQVAPVPQAPPIPQEVPQGVAQPAMNAPVQPAATATETWVCPVCGTAGNVGRFCQGCAAPKPDPTVQQGGLMYDPNGNIE